MTRRLAPKKKNNRPAQTDPNIPPAPFVRVPNSPPFKGITSFLSLLPKHAVVLTHLDATPIPLKRLVFCVPLLLNLAIIVLLLLRARHVIPWYATTVIQTLHSAQQLMLPRSWWLIDGGSLRDLVRRWGVLGRLIGRTVMSGGGGRADFMGGTWTSMIIGEAWLAINLSTDWVLFTQVSNWTWTFFFDSRGSPVAWRLLGGGFRERDVIVRMSRGWTVKDLLHSKDSKSRGEDSPFWKTRVLPYVAMESISKTGYTLMDSNWDLEFGIMLKTQKIIAAKLVNEDEINGKLWAWWEPVVGTGEWVVWDFRAELYPRNSSPSTSNLSSATSSATTTATSNTEETAALTSSSSSSSPTTDVSNVEDVRKMVEKLRTKLTEMGKEELFWSWVELVHRETSKPGGFTDHRQEEVGQQARKLFADHNVDWDTFEREVGIVDGRLVF